MGQVIPFPTKLRKPLKSANKPTAKKLTILLAEDHSALRDIVSIYLMRQGYHIRTAGNGKTALEILATEDIDLLLLDLMLPWVDGFEVLQRLRTEQGDRFPYVIVVSALTTEADRKKVQELGGDDYLPKPFHLPNLLERIQAVEAQMRSGQRPV
jgi:DNA-binding response OmpR family regulator